MLNRTLLVGLTVALCSSVALGGTDVEIQIVRPMAIEVPGLVPITARLTNNGDTWALVDSVRMTISDGFNHFVTGVPLSPGESKLVFMPVPWVCPADSEETCKAWITIPADSNHSNDTDVVIINSTWQRTYDGGHGSDGSRSVIMATYDGFVSAGWTTTIAGDLDVYLVKTNAYGDTLWTRTYGGPGYDVANSVQQTSGNGYIIVGRTTSYGAGDEDVFIVRTDSLGDMLWTRTYGGAGIDAGNSIEQAADSGFIIAGTTHSFGAGSADVWLLRLDASGDTLWTRTYGGPLWDRGEAVQRTLDGGFVIAGGALSFGAGLEDVYLIKTDSLGDTLWTKTFGGPDYDYALSVSQTFDFGYVVAGATGASNDTGKSDVADAYLVKTDTCGHTLWTRTYGGANYEAAYSVQQTADGGFIFGGVTSSSGAGDRDVYLVKTDSIGDTLWTRTYGGTAGDEGRSIQDIISNYIIAGLTGSFGASDDDVYLIKTKGQLDVGPVAILSPSGTAEHGSVYVPRVVVRNFGMTSGLLSVTMDIGSGYSRTVQETLVSVPVETLEFPPWTADPVGSTSITCFTSLAGDQRPTNDTIGDSVQVLRVNDVAATAILSPPGIAESGRAYMPSATIRSFGLNTMTFPVTMQIGAGYSRTVTETLASGLSDTVVFPAWTADPLGPLEVTCFTSLAGDEDPANDTIHDSIQVVPPPHHDVGAVAIISPSGSVRAGDIVIPRTRIRNFGDRQERFFDVRFRLGASYNEKVNVSDALPPGSTAELAFPPWVAEAGNWAVSCSTMLASDLNRANDKISSSVQVFPQSLSIAPDQSDRIEAGKSKSYRFYALIQGDTGAVVEVARPSAPSGWSLWLCDATGADDLTDTDGDGIPDLGYVAPSESGWFSLDVTAPSGTQGDTASLGQTTFLVAGHVGDRPDIADSAALSLTLLPAFSVHNFPNPFSDHTAFVIGLPEDGKASLTVYTRAGERVCRVIANSNLPAGTHFVRWDGVNDNGRGIAPGTYEYLLDYVHSGKTEHIRKRLVFARQ